MVVRFSDRLEIRDLPPPPSSLSTASSSTQSLGPLEESRWQSRQGRDNYSRRERAYLAPPQSRRIPIAMTTAPVHLRADSLLTTEPQRRSYDDRPISSYDPVADDPPVPLHSPQPMQSERPVLQQTAVMNWALPPGYYQQQEPKKISRLQRLGESWLFLTCIRTACLLLTLSAIFACAFSQYWTEKAPVVLGMVFSILSAMVMGAAVSVIFIWDMPTMNLAKRILFSLLFAIMSLTAGVLYTVGVSVCSSYNQYGCFVTNMSPALKVAAAFSYIALVISLVDCALTFYFYRFDPAARAVAENQGAQPTDGRPPIPPPIHTEV